jgi:hypothetical protein
MCAGIGSGVAVAQARAETTTTVAPGSRPKATDYWGAVNGSISAGAIIVGGILGYRRYLKERPYFARANLSLTADLFSDDGADFVRAAVGAESIGKKTLELVPSNLAQGEAGCFVAVYPYRGEAAQKPRARPLRAVAVFAQQYVESGETIEETVMLAVGTRRPGVLAYRVEFTIKAIDSEAGGQAFTWTASAFVPAGLGVQGGGSGGPAG